jgi:hypothetical protein
MSDTPVKENQEPDFKCPECRSPLKQRRTRKPNECELLCGGCGAMFDICDLETLDELKKRQ